MKHRIILAFVTLLRLPLALVQAAETSAPDKLQPPVTSADPQPGA